MNNMLKYKGYYGSVEFSSADQIFFGKVIGVSSLISFEGDSVETLREDFEGAVDEYISICEEKGIEPEKSYKGSFNVRISPDLHKKLVVYSMAHGRSLNATVEEAIRQHVAL